MRYAGRPAKALIMNDLRKPLDSAEFLRYIKRMNERTYALTDDEANAVKDVIRTVGTTKYRRVILETALTTGRKPSQLDKLLDSAFIKLGNGRLTVTTDKDEWGPK